MRYYNNILELVGNTPLIRINRLSAGLDPLILAKAEFLNPGGSIKDRIGKPMIEAAEREGKLNPGWTIVEPTSGNTGVGLALVALLKGYKLAFTMPDKMSMEKENLLKAFGGKVVRTPTAVEPDDPQSYYKIAEKMVEEIGTAYSPNQYFNPNNPRAHYETTGPEIWRDTDGKVTHLVCGMGTGGTISGAGKYLKEMNPDIKIIGVDPEGSIYHEEFYKTHGEVHTYKTEGIGEDFIPPTIDLSIIDEIVIVGDREAFLTARRLTQEEGLFVGSSSGAAMYGALEVAKKAGKDAVIVVILPDTGRNYLSTLYNDEWMKNQGFL